MPKKPATDTRQHILDVARTLMTTKGYTAVGLAEVVAAAGVPKGSFYYYFKSKEEFGQALLDEYFSEYLGRVDGILGSASPARERLIAYFEYWSQTQGSVLPEGKCLVVKLGPEVCDLSEDMRGVLERGTSAIVSRLVRCIEQGHADGSIAASVQAQATAEGLYQLWLGASLMAKVTHTTSPFEGALSSSLKLLS